MTLYHYCVLSKSEASHLVGRDEGIDMENVDYKRQPDITRVAEYIDSANGLCCGLFRGGMFGLATNQLALLSAWENPAATSPCAELAQQNGWSLSDEARLIATVRPTDAKKIDRAGIYVIRWIRMLESDIDEYTRLCLETWPAFEAMTHSRCYGVFRPLESADVVKLLMLTWYASLTDWEQSRQLNPADQSKWARRSEMELSHWAETGRLAL